MAIINLLPFRSKRSKSGKNTDFKFSSSKAHLPSRGLSVSMVFAIILSLIIILFLLGVLFMFVNQANSKTEELNSLNQKIKNLNAEYQKINDLNKRKEELTEMISFYEGIFQNKIAWSEKLYLINKYLPSQIWLTNIYTESKPSKILVIKGLATSLLEAEIIASITGFANKLKEDNAFSKDFVEIKLGPLQSGKKENLALMDFSLYCKFR